MYFTRSETVKITKDLQEVGCVVMDWIGPKKNIAEQLAIFEIIRIQNKKLEKQEKRQSRLEEFL